jgi:tetratricopeptide (TPR) repeat protein
MSGQYGEALAALEKVLDRQPEHMEALRLKGNVLELTVLDRAQYRSEKLLRSKDWLAARKSYESILSLDPENTLALIDLGDHYRNMGASTKSLEYYEAAIVLLEKGQFRWSKKAEVDEVCSHAAELYAELERDEDAARIEQISIRLVNRMRARQSRRRVKKRTSAGRR